MAQSQAADKKRISRDRWSIGLWAFCLFMAASLALAIEAALSSNLALAAMIAQTFGLLLLSQSTPLEIAVSQDYLYVGKASIERKFITHVEVLDAEAMRITRGPKADVSAYLALRFWVPTGAKITISDSNDPTPYWLISTKSAVKLKAELAK